MSHLQDPVRQPISSPPSSGSALPARTRPFTRVSNSLFDTVKPKLKHKVDRSVLDALVRALEGFHRPWVAMMIDELSQKAAVSNWSITHALKRLEAEEIIVRRKKKMLSSGRYIWDIALTEPYRVDVGIEPLGVTPSAAAKPAVGLQKAPPQLELDLTSESSTPLRPPAPREVEPALPLPASPEPERVAVDPPQLELDLTSESPAPLRPPASREVEPALPLLAPPEPERVTCEAPESRPGKLELTLEQKQAQMRLSQVGVSFGQACKLALTQPPELIHRVVEHLKHRVGTVRNPAAWIVRELERGGYDLPPTVLEQERRRAEQETKARLQREAQEHQAEQARVQEAAVQVLLERFRKLPTERQRELEEQTRQALRRISPRLAKAPLDLEIAGPMRSQLLELLEKEEPVGSPLGELDLSARLGSRSVGPTPRRGGFERNRGTLAASESVLPGWQADDGHGYG